VPILIGAKETFKIVCMKEAPRRSIEFEIAKRKVPHTNKKI
jgi:hypothetical protein